MQTLPRIFFLFAVIFASLLHRQGSAEVLRFKFFGQVQFVPVPETEWGAIIPFPAPVVGQFSFETNTPLTQPSNCTDCARYLQQISNGFVVSLGNLNIRADDYSVQVSNNQPQSSQSVFDFADNLLILFDSQRDGPIYVGGIPQPKGQLLLSFTGNSSVFSDTQLPRSINLSVFPLKIHFVDDLRKNGSMDAQFSISSIKSCRMVPGDFDCDEDVDNNDYQQWRNAYGLTNDMSFDANGDHSVNSADYTIWRDHMGFEFLAGPSVVPEPSFLLLFLGALTSYGLFPLFLPVRRR